MKLRGGWVIELDIQSFFDEVDHARLRAFLDQRVRDGVVRRAIGKWLKAGVMEDGQLSYRDAGTPQGGIVSPLLANIFLHEVLDRWFAEQLKPRLRGGRFMVRYADDAVLVFERENDARRVMAVLAQRFSKYGLRLHPEKTRLVAFARPSDERPPRGGPDGGCSFDWLGFTHFWAHSRKGRWVIKRKTSKASLRRALYRLGQWCRRNRHLPVREQHAELVSKLRGHYAYYGITGNSKALARFAHEAVRLWRKWLDRRSGKAKMGWERFRRLLYHYPLPTPRIVHSVYR